MNQFNISTPILKKKESLLLIIDVQENLIKSPNNNLHSTYIDPSTQKMLKINISSLIETAKLMDIPILITEHVPDKLGKTTLNIRESLGNLYQPIKKNTFNCNLDPDFKEKISKMTRKNVIVTGIESHICIAQTVYHLMSNYSVFVAYDAIASGSSIDHDIAVQRMRSKGAEITTTESIIYELSEFVPKSQFNNILQIVKLRRKLIADRLQTYKSNK